MPGDAPTPCQGVVTSPAARTVPPAPARLLIPTQRRASKPLGNRTYNFIEEIKLQLRDGVGATPGQRLWAETPAPSLGDQGLPGPRVCVWGQLRGRAVGRGARAGGGMGAAGMGGMDLPARTRVPQPRGCGHGLLASGWGGSPRLGGAGVAASSTSPPEVGKGSRWRVLGSPRQDTVAAALGIRLPRRSLSSFLPPIRGEGGRCPSPQGRGSRKSGC